MAAARDIGVLITAAAASDLRRLVIDWELGERETALLCTHPGLARLHALELCGVDPESEAKGHVSRLSFKCRTLSACLGAAGAARLGAALAAGAAPELRVLVLAWNNIGADGARALAGALVAVPQLQTLNLAYNGIGRGGALALAGALVAVPQLQTLYLAYNDIGADGARALAGALVAVPQLQTLSLAYNGIGDDGARALAGALVAVPQLQTLDLGRNDIGADGARALAGALVAMPQLWTLSLFANGIGADGARALAGALVAVPQLRTLNLGSNRIGADGARALAGALVAVPQLQTLDLGENDIDGDGARALAGALVAVPQLRTLILDSNRIGADGARALAGALVAVPQLQTLSFGGNELDDALSQEIDAAVEANRRRAPQAAPTPSVPHARLSGTGAATASATVSRQPTVDAAAFEVAALRNQLDAALTHARDRDADATAAQQQVARLTESLRAANARADAAQAELERARAQSVADARAAKAVALRLTAQQDELAATVRRLETELATTDDERTVARGAVALLQARVDALVAENRRLASTHGTAAADGQVAELRALLAASQRETEDLYRERARHLYTSLPSPPAAAVTAGPRALDITLESLTFGRRLGVGSFKTVFAGRLHGFPVALAVLRANVQLEREAFLLAALSKHPGVVQFFGSCRNAAGETVLVTSLADGSLDALLVESAERGAPLALALKRRVCAQVCGAMAFLAASGVVHRDLAARNVLYTGQGEGLQVCVTDFGLSALLDAGAAAIVSGIYSAGGSSVLPTRWVPPETLVDRMWTEASDVWAFGVLMWEVFADGAMPYAEIADDVGVALRVSAGRRLGRPGDCPEPLYALMLACWAADAAQRPTFAALLRRAELASE